MISLDNFGTAISDIVGPTVQLLEPLLRENEKKIRSTKCQTFSYGSHARQNLDVYAPATRATGKLQDSVFIFLYGGGLVRGDKVQANVADGLVYANLGHFFAENAGVPVVIVDYRLISHGAVFPSGGEDLALAVDWVEEYFSEGKTKVVDIFIMGNSAGGIHLSTFLLASEFARNRQHLTDTSSRGAKLKGAVLLAVPFHFGQAHPSRKETIDVYFKQDHPSLCPFGLLKGGLQNDSVGDLTNVGVLILSGSLDPEDEILIPGRDFVKLWQESSPLAEQLKVASMQGHNHLSPVMCLGTGLESEEAWAWQVIQFMKATVACQ